MISLLVSYSIGGFIAFLIWLKLFLNDSTASLSDYNSWRMLLFVTCLWPITAPVSLIEIGLKNKPVQESLKPSAPANPLPLGYLLKKAGLISESQVIRALEIQQATDKQMRIGEIIAYQGWLKQETIDFFAECLPQMRSQPKQRIGQYLKLARLLNDRQIKAILDEQLQTDLRFGEIAVLKGWVNTETVNFIIRHLQGEPLAISLSK
jgi:hypothetical protein